MIWNFLDFQSTLFFVEKIGAKTVIAFTQLSIDNS